jgi:hypothetical protein
MSDRYGIPLLPSIDCTCGTPDCVDPRHRPTTPPAPEQREATVDMLARAAQEYPHQLVRGVCRSAASFLAEIDSSSEAVAEYLEQRFGAALLASGRRHLDEIAQDNRRGRMPSKPERPKPEQRGGEGEKTVGDGSAWNCPSAEHDTPSNRYRGDPAVSKWCPDCLAARLAAETARADRLSDNTRDLVDAALAAVPKVGPVACAERSFLYGAALKLRSVLDGHCGFWQAAYATLRASTMTCLQCRSVIRLVDCHTGFVVTDPHAPSRPEEQKTINLADTLCRMAGDTVWEKGLAVETQRAEKAEKERDAARDILGAIVVLCTQQPGEVVRYHADVGLDAVAGILRERDAAWAEAERLRGVVNAVAWSHAAEDENVRCGTCLCLVTHCEHADARDSERKCRGAEARAALGGEGALLVGLETERLRGQFAASEAREAELRALLERVLHRGLSEQGLAGWPGLVDEARAALVCP